MQASGFNKLREAFALAGQSREALSERSERKNWRCNPVSFLPIPNFLYALKARIFLSTSPFSATAD
jgi:hypothetical protein